MDSQVFDRILSMIRDRGRSYITKQMKVVIFFKYAREGISQCSLAKTVGLSQSSISRLISEIVEDIVQSAHLHIKWPETKEEVWTMENDFLKKGRRIRAYGVLDGKHFKTEHPAGSGSLNRNYKSFYSFNSLFVSDSSNRIFYVQLSALGVNSDSQMFRDGPLGRKLAETRQMCKIRSLPNSNIDMGAFLLADNGFGLTKEIMQPYRSSSLSCENMLFNRELSAVRVTVENTFGLLASRFRVFQRALNLTPRNSRSLIISLSVVHNIIIGDRQIDSNFPPLPIIIDRYQSAEAQRSALKRYVLQT
uniref:DDE Tnp4 domain-containing protein n=2 Tax=Caenorhabditis japonica TaxID=281687 RepID=A0A8R1EJD5_CAEJA